MLIFALYRMIRRHTRKVRALSLARSSPYRSGRRASGRLSAFSPATWKPPCNRISISIINMSPGISDKSPIAKPKEHYPIELFQERPIDRREPDGYSTPAFGCLGLGSR